MKNFVDFLTKNQIEYREDVSLKELTTYQCGGNVKYVVFPKDVNSLIVLLNFLKNGKIKYKVFGNGSNILASDRDYDGVIIKLNNFNKFEIIDCQAVLGAGVYLSVIANKLSRLGYSGLEFACGIPGTIGGAIYMNAGAYLKDMSSIVVDVTVLDDDLNVKVLSNEEMQFSYRHSILSSKNYICLEARIQLEKVDKCEIIKLISDRLQRRILSQPLEYPSAGSVFRNPVGDYAGRLIEACNLKGKSIGGAMISDKHANFIINRNSAKAKDVKDLIDMARSEVNKKFNIDLQVEQEMFNWE